MNIHAKIIEAHVARLRRADEKAALVQMNRSIHPRNWGPQTILTRGIRKKSNTCGAPKPATRARKVAAMTAHIERHPNDAASRAHLAKIQAGA